MGSHLPTASRYKLDTATHPRDRLMLAACQFSDTLDTAHQPLELCADNVWSVISAMAGKLRP